MLTKYLFRYNFISIALANNAEAKLFIVKLSKPPTTVKHGLVRINRILNDILVNIFSNL